MCACVEGLELFSSVKQSDLSPLPPNPILMKARERNCMHPHKCVYECAHFFGLNLMKVFLNVKHSVGGDNIERLYGN